MSTLTRPQSELDSLLENYLPQLAAHPLYPQLQSLKDIQLFMRSHVFAVWDFMTLLKALQQQLTCVSLPWRPVGDGQTRRLINEIVSEEESDLGPDGQYYSHFELYCRAMRACGADTNPIEHLLNNLNHKSLPESLNSVDLPPGAETFVQTTWSIVSSGSLPAIAAAFTLGREAVIPGMFTKIVKQLHTRYEGLGELVYYLERHIELDGDHHGPLAWRMLESVCHSPSDWQAAQTAGREALEARIKLWDAIAASL